MTLLMIYTKILVDSLLNRKLRIGVDARPLSGSLKGIGRYLMGLINNFDAQSSDIEFYLYSIAPVPKSINNISITTRDIGVRIGLLNTAVAQVVFPIWAVKDNVDLFWSPRHHLPLLLPKSIKTIVTIHDLVCFRCPETMTKLGVLLDKYLMPHSVRVANHVTCVSHYTAKDLRHILGRYSSVSIVSPAANDYSELVDSDRFCKKDSYFLFVGTYEPRKNLARLIIAFSEAVKKNISVSRLVIVGGDGWGDTDEVELVDALGLSDLVSIEGYVSESRLAELYQGAHVLVMPSLYEGFGIPILEAMSCGVPVMTSNISSMPEVGGKAAYLVDPYSINSIVDAFVNLSENHSLHRNLSANAKAQFSMYSWSESAKKLVDIFRSL